MSAERPRQAVVVAGGRGTRLAPITDTTPKAMVPFHGRPFLEYLVELLRDQGFERILLLLGYRADAIVEYFGDGSSWGVEVEYDVTGPDDQTASRVRHAQDRLDEIFLFLYCDNYWPMRFDALWAAYEAAEAPAQVTVYRNRDGYTSDRMRVENGRVRAWDKRQGTAGLRGTEISYAILERETVLDLLPPLGAAPEQDVPFEQAVYPPLIARGELAAYETDHRYYSVGSHERLALTEAFLARTPTVILDRDGTLNRRPPRAQYVTRPEDFLWLPGALEALQLLRAAGYRTLLVTNQAGIDRGALTEQDLAEVHGKMAADAEAAGGRIDRVYHCPHGWDEGCECRKPRPGMLLQAQREFSLDLTRTLFIGDDERDGEAAAAAGAPFAMVTDDVSLLDHVKRLTAASSPNTVSACIS